MVRGAECCKQIVFPVAVLKSAVMSATKNGIIKFYVSTHQLDKSSTNPHLVALSNTIKIGNARRKIQKKVEEVDAHIYLNS